MNFPIYQRLNELICLKGTGPVDALAEKLDVSPRKVKYMIQMMKESCDSPIHFDFTRQSYVYTQDGCCDFRFRPNKREYITKAVNEVLRKCLSALMIYGCFNPDLIGMVGFLPQVN